MSNATPPPSLLQALCDVGTRMVAALQADDLATLFALADERAGLVDRLRAFAHPADVDAAWPAYAETLAEQERVLTRGLAAQEARLDRALRRTRQLDQARQCYDGHAAPVRRQVLDPRLHG